MGNPTQKLPELETRLAMSQTFATFKLLGNRATSNSVGGRVQAVVVAGV